MPTLSLPVHPRDHVRGLPGAPVVLVEYGDYQCAHCGRAYPIVRELQRRFGDSLAFVFRNFPLTALHPEAFRAAETAEWAAFARKFWPMHDALFEHQHSLDDSSLLTVASHLGLDRRQLAVAWHDHALRARVAEDLSSGVRSGVRGTPTFFINGEMHEASWDLETLSEALVEAGALESAVARRRVPARVP